jgi:hypothetical protein
MGIAFGTLPVDHEKRHAVGRELPDGAEDDAGQDRAA